MLKALSCILLLFILSGCDRTTVIHPERKNIVETVYASGKIISENEYSVFALSNGTVKEKLVKDGDTVSKGKVLYEINNESSSARLEAATANFELARLNLSPQSRILNDLKIGMQNAAIKFSNDSLNYSRMKNLLAQNATSKVNVDNAYANYTISLNQKKSAEEKYYSTMNELKLAFENAKSQLAAAQSELDNYFIKSESGGTVFQTLKEKGEAVHAGEVIALLGSTSQRIIKLSVDQQDIDKIKTGQEVLLKSDVTGNTIYHAAVSQIYPMMNELDQTYRVDALFNDSVPQRFIHSSVEANIIIQQKNNALIIPYKAISTGDSVKIKDGTKTKYIVVKTGIRTMEDIEIVSGLDESSEVIIPSQK